MRSALLGLGLSLLCGCSPKDSARLSWDFNALPAEGEVRVLPALHLHELPGPRYDSYVTASVPDWRAVLRRERAAQVAALPDEVARALPGAINAELRDDWAGRFRCGRWPPGAQRRLSAALLSGRAPDAALRQIGRRSAGDAVLVTWIDALESVPLTTLGFPGEPVWTPLGTMVVDLVQEQHRVSARVGVALVAADGQIVMRLVQDTDAVLSLRISPADAARRMARDVARDMALVWPTEDRLRRAAQAPQLALR